MKSVNIIVLLFLFNCLVSGQSTKVSIGNLNAFNGDSVVVPINVSDFYNVGAVTLKLEIDPNVLLWGRSLNWNPSMNGGLSGYKNNSVIIAWDGINGVNIQAGEIVQLKFKYISGSSDIKFVVSACEIADVEGNLLNISYVNGTVSQTPVPAEPVLLSPENNKTNTAVNLQFDWNDVPNAYNYDFQLATDVNFTNIFAYASHLNLSQVDIFNLANETNYFWRVKANNPTGSGNWSQVFTFTTIVNIPDKPVLIFPMNNSLNNLTTIQFRWKKVNKAQKYFYELSKDSLFSALVEKDTTLTDTIKYVGTLEFNSKYFWRVKSKNIGGSGLWSDIASFSTIYKFNVSGNVFYANSAQTPLGNVTVYLNKNGANIDTTTTSDGKYLFNDVLKGEYKLFANSNAEWRSVNSTDALLIRRNAVGLIQFSPIQQKSADVNISGNINSNDALDVRRRIVYQIELFSAGDWYFENPTFTVNKQNVIQDINGIIVGDVNGSYSDVLPKLGSDLYLFAKNEGVNENNSNLLFFPLLISEDCLIGAITLEFEFDQESIEFVKAETKLKNYSLYVDGNKLIVAWDGVDGILFSENESLINLVFASKNKRIHPSVTLKSISEISDIYGNSLDCITALSKQGRDIPLDFSLSQNYPNPFNGETIIKFALSNSAHVSLGIYNVLGQKVLDLLSDNFGSGYHSVKFSAGNFTSGIYFYKLIINNGTSVHKFIKKMIHQK